MFLIIRFGIEWHTLCHLYPLSSFKGGTKSLICIFLRSLNICLLGLPNLPTHTSLQTRACLASRSSYNLKCSLILISSWLGGSEGTCCSWRVSTVSIYCFFFLFSLEKPFFIFFIGRIDTVSLLRPKPWKETNALQKNTFINSFRTKQSGISMKSWTPDFSGIVT